MDDSYNRLEGGTRVQYLIDEVSGVDEPAHEISGWVVPQATGVAKYVGMTLKQAHGIVRRNRPVAIRNMEAALEELETVYLNAAKAARGAHASTQMREPGSQRFRSSLFRHAPDQKKAHPVLAGGRFFKG